MCLIKRPMSVYWCWKYSYTEYPSFRFLLILNCCFLVFIALYLTGIMSLLSPRNIWCWLQSYSTNRIVWVYRWCGQLFSVEENYFIQLTNSFFFLFLHIWGYFTDTSVTEQILKSKEFDVQLIPWTSSSPHTYFCLTSVLTKVIMGP